MELFNNVTEQSSTSELYAALKAGFDEVSTIDHNSIEAGPLREGFCNWRQKLGGVVTWYNVFTKHKDYSSGINAAMALGKFGTAAAPNPSIVEYNSLANMSLLGEYIWTDIKRGNRAE